MAQSKLHINAILTGYVDCLCLVCECHLKCEQDALLHTKNSEHQKKLEAATYMVKYGDNNIRKVKRGYYCGLCNKLLMTGTKVDLHVTESAHEKNKGVSLLKHSDKGVVYKNVVVSARAWQGLVEDSCCICDLEVPEMDTHIMEPMHLISLIQSDIQFGENGSLYRMIDKESFQCLTCNQVLPLKIVKIHSQETEHQSIYTNAILSNVVEVSNGHGYEEKKTRIENNTNHILSEEFKAVIIHESKPEPTAENETEDLTNNENTILDDVHIFQKNEININFETKTAFCKKCLSNVEFNCHTIDDHITDHKIYSCVVKSALAYPSSAGSQTKEVFERPEASRPNISDNENIRHKIRALTFKEHNVPIEAQEEDGEFFDVSSESDCTDILSGVANSDNNNDQKSNKDGDLNIEDYAKTHNITYNAVNRVAYCRCCEARVPLSLNAFVEHVAGVAHKIKSKKVTQKLKASKAKNCNINVVPNSSKISITKASSEEYILEIIGCKNSFHRDFIINKEFCITFMSFMTLTEEGAGSRCQVCSRYVPDHELGVHVESNGHQMRLKVTPVILTVTGRGNFVREVQPNVYHCAPCNKVMSGFPQLIDHLTTLSHMREKALDEGRLHSRLLEYREERERLFLLHMLLRNPFF